jgi:hypothetical protein
VVSELTSSDEVSPAFGDGVIVLDEVTLSDSQYEAWMAHWLSDYRPGALQRGLRLRGIWRASTRRPDEVMVVICWSVPRVGPYWMARWEATDDPKVADFWAQTDAIARTRGRRVFENVMMKS